MNSFGVLTSLNLTNVTLKAGTSITSSLPSSLISNKDY